MLKKLFVIGLLLSLFLFLGHTVGFAQSDTPRFEIGPQFSALKLKYSFRGREGTTETADDYWLGFGGRVSYNLNDNIAVEAVVQKFHTDVVRPLTFSTAAQPDIQGLFGLKGGVRRKTVGFFGKVRPGFTRFTPVFDCTAIDFRTCSEIRHTGFSMDMGGVVEGYNFAALYGARGY